MSRSSYVPISASILSADFCSLGREIESVLNAGADSIHLDVMDYTYVPNLTVGPVVCSSLSANTSATIEVHLMSDLVDTLVESFCDAGASAISFHPDAKCCSHRNLSFIKSRGLRAGVAISPSTPLCVLDHICDLLDYVIVMTVDPGFGGQKFIPGMIDKVKMVKKITERFSSEIKIIADGGVDDSNVFDLYDAGADCFVVGSYVFKSGLEYDVAISNLRRSLVR